MLNYLRTALIAAISFGLFALAPPARAASDSEELVIKSQLLLEKLARHPDFSSYRRTLKEARGVLVIPSLIKGAFIIGAEGGSGVLMGRKADGTWSHPAFFTLGAGSVGLQIGVQDTEVVFVIMTEAGLNAVISNEVKLGVDASISFGPIGRGLEGSTTTGLGADIAAFSKSVGAFAGGSLEGAVIHERMDYNRQYYGDDGATARRVVVMDRYSNPHANAIRKVLAAGG
jgi:lipid-binding SYLF domain-containing protein